VERRQVLGIGKVERMMSPCALELHSCVRKGCPLRTTLSRAKSLLCTSSVIESTMAEPFGIAAGAVGIAAAFTASFSTMSFAIQVSDRFYFAPDKPVSQS